MAITNYVVEEYGKMLTINHEVQKPCYQICNYDLNFAKIKNQSLSIGICRPGNQSYTKTITTVFCG